MDFRVVWLSGIVVGTASVAAACDAPDPGQVVYSERSKTESSGGTSGQASSSGTSGSTSSSGSSGGDGGGSSSGEGGAADPVFGTSAFAPGTPGQNANGAAGDHGGNVEGRDCMVTGCHLDKGPKWGFAGTVYSTATGGATVKNAEVRVTGPDGKTFGMAYTDDNGNFWFDGAGAKPPANSRAGVRTATKKMTMAGTVAGDSGAACNSTACHGNAAMKLYIQ